MTNKYKIKNIEIAKIRLLALGFIMYIDRKDKSISYSRKSVIYPKDRIIIYERHPYFMTNTLYYFNSDREVHHKDIEDLLKERLLEVVSPNSNDLIQRLLEETIIYLESNKVALTEVEVMRIENEIENLKNILEGG